MLAMGGVFILYFSYPAWQPFVFSPFFFFSNLPWNFISISTEIIDADGVSKQNILN